MANTNKEYESLKASSVSLVGANSDGKNLYLEVEVFDGEHTNRFEPEFPLNASAADITEYFKNIIEKNPKLPDEIVGLLQKKLFWDNTEKAYFWQSGNEKPVKLEEKKSAPAATSTVKK